MTLQDTSHANEETEHNGAFFHVPMNTTPSAKKGKINAIDYKCLEKGTVPLEPVLSNFRRRWEKLLTAVELFGSFRLQSSIRNDDELRTSTTINYHELAFVGSRTNVLGQHDWRLDPSRKEETPFDTRSKQKMQEMTDRRTDLRNFARRKGEQFAVNSTTDESRALRGCS